MNSKKLKKKTPGGRGMKRGNKSSIKQDPFFNSEPTKRRRKENYDEDVESGDSEEENGVIESDLGSGDGNSSEEERERETADERRQRMAKAYVEKMRKIAERDEEEEEEEMEGGDRVYEKEGERDSLVAKKLMEEQLEESGRVRRSIASRIQEPKSDEGFRVLVKHRFSVTSLCLSSDDLKGFSASKDGTILHWDVESGKSEKYQWPTVEVLKSHGAKDPQGRVAKHSRQVLALAVSSDDRYLASGGLDRQVHLWDTRTRQHVQAFPGHRGPVSSLTFRQGSSELFSGSFDRSIKIWNVNDRAYVSTLFGHQSEVLTVDCLRKERVLAAGRDRTMQLFKVPEESRLIFRASASSLECCCFIDNEDFLSGSDDGNIELWGLQKKKPVYIVKNAHALTTDPKNYGQNDNAKTFNGHLAYSWVSSVAVCRGSDLAASGAGNDSVRLWATESDPKSLRPLYTLPLVGFVNSLAFAKSGKFLVAGVGKEPRLGRWGQISAAQNGVSIQSLRHS